MKLELLHTGVLGVNTWIVPLVGNAVFIVDPAGSRLTGDETSVSDFIEKNELIPVGIFLTHGHFDHVAGLKCLREKWKNICISIHSADAECIGSRSAEIQKKFLSSLGADSAELLDSVSELPAPDVLLENDMTLDKAILPEKIVSSFSQTKSAFSADEVLNALSRWTVIHTPGHSKGSVCFYNSSEKVLISGDTIFYGSCGRTDLYGGDERVLNESICAIAENSEKFPKDTLVYPGHDFYGFTLGSNYR